MPSDRDDPYFGAKRGSSQKAFEAMVQHYGYSKAVQVWHAMKADRRKAGKRFDGRERDR